MLLLKLIVLISLRSTPALEDRQVVGKLVEKVEPGVHCGILAVASVGKFIIYKDGQQTKETLKVVIRCPADFGGRDLKSGNQYKLVISDDMELLKNYVVNDKYPHSNLKKVVLVNFEKYK